MGDEVKRYQLRPYQKKLISDIRNHLNKGHKRIVTVLGCGGGKSIVQGAIAYNATRNGHKVLCLVHRQELQDQARIFFRGLDVDMTLCQIGMVQTVRRRIKTTSVPKLIIIDECHHALAKSYLKIIDTFDGAIVLGFTATPIRMVEGGLGAVFDKMVQGVSTKWLISNKYLSEYRYYGVTLADTTQLHIHNGDYDKKEIDLLIHHDYIFGDVMKNWKAYAEGKQTIVYCSSIETSNSIAATFREHGISAEHIDGLTPTRERCRMFNEFRNGQLQVLCNVDLFGEGIDIVDCECVVLLRPTCSLGLFIQQSMRCLRYKEGKTAIILDHVGNYLRHGLPDDDRCWTLAGVKKSEAQHKKCPVCQAISSPVAKVCNVCGYEFTDDDTSTGTDTTATRTNKVIEKIMLHEVQRIDANDYTQCKSFEDLDHYRKARRLSFKWLVFRCRELDIPIPDRFKRIIDANHW